MNNNLSKLILVQPLLVNDFSYLDKVGIGYDQEDHINTVIHRYGAEAYIRGTLKKLHTLEVPAFIIPLFPSFVTYLNSKGSPFSIVTINFSNPEAVQYYGHLISSLNSQATRLSIKSLYSAIENLLKDMDLDNVSRYLMLQRNDCFENYIEWFLDLED